MASSWDSPFQRRAAPRITRDVLVRDFFGSSGSALLDEIGEEVEEGERGSDQPAAKEPDEIVMDDREQEMIALMEERAQAFDVLDKQAREISSFDMKERVAAMAAVAEAKHAAGIEVMPLLEEIEEMMEGGRGDYPGLGSYTESLLKMGLVERAHAYASGLDVPPVAAGEAKLSMAKILMARGLEIERVDRILKEVETLSGMIPSGKFLPMEMEVALLKQQRGRDSTTILAGIREWEHGGWSDDNMKTYALTVARLGDLARADRIVSTMERFTTQTEARAGLAAILNATSPDEASVRWRSVCRDAEAAFNMPQSAYAYQDLFTSVIRAGIDLGMQDPALLEETKVLIEKNQDVFFKTVDYGALAKGYIEAGNAAEARAQLARMRVFIETKLNTEEGGRVQNARLLLAQLEAALGEKPIEQIQAMKEKAHVIAGRHLNDRHVYSYWIVEPLLAAATLEMEHGVDPTDTIKEAERYLGESRGFAKAPYQKQLIALKTDLALKRVQEIDRLLKQ